MCRWCTRWSCSTGPSAARSRGGWSRSRASCPTCPSPGGALRISSEPDVRPVPMRSRTSTPLPDVDYRFLRGPFDIIGDVHGCADELVELLQALGYRVALAGKGRLRRANVKAPAGR